jgi:hypothetical protein
MHFIFVYDRNEIHDKSIKSNIEVFASEILQKTSSAKMRCALYTHLAFMNRFKKIEMRDKVFNDDSTEI